MPSKVCEPVDTTMGWILLWVVIFSAPALFWLTMWLLLPPPVFFALLCMGPVLGFLISCWYALPGAGKPGRTQRPAVPSGVPIATPVSPAS